MSAVHPIMAATLQGFDAQFSSEQTRRIRLANEDRQNRYERIKGEVENDDAFLIAEVARHADDDVVFALATSAVDCFGEVKRLIEAQTHQGTALVRVLRLVEQIGRGMDMAIGTETLRRERAEIENRRHSVEG